MANIVLHFLFSPHSEILWQIYWLLSRLEGLGETVNKGVVIAYIVALLPTLWDYSPLM